MIVSLATGIAAASAAKTGTKTMSDSSIYPPGTPPPVFYSDKLSVITTPHNTYSNYST